MISKDHSPTRPHKGDGRTSGTYLLSQQTLQPAMTIRLSPAILWVNPYPLGGGVGEGNP